VNDVDWCHFGLVWIGKSLGEMPMRVIPVALAALIGSHSAIAGEWTQFNVSSTPGEQGGTAAKITGVIATAMEPGVHNWS